MALMSVSATSIISRYLTNKTQTTKTSLYILKMLGILQPIIHHNLNIPRLITLHNMSPSTQTVGK